VSAAYAEALSTLDAVQSWGLLGVWSSDCSLRPGEKNAKGWTTFYYSYEPTADLNSVRVSLSNDTNAPKAGSIDTARVLQNGMLETLGTSAASGKRYRQIQLQNLDRLQRRNWYFAYIEAGVEVATVIDGKYTSGPGQGKPAGWVYRCPVNIV
jgi:hypothetical protein